MLKSLMTLQLIAVLLFPGYAVEPFKIKVVDLSCENLTNPLGIATASPGMSWKIRSEINGTEQIAYQVLAASDSVLLDENKADLWNSERVASAASVLVSWRGKELGARSVVYWKVRVWDQDNKLSEWSNVASFSVGLLKKEDWHSAYIGLPREAGNPENPQFTRRFNLSGKAEKRLLYINSLGYHEVFINGKKVGDGVLSPAVSQFNKRSLSITYDVSQYLQEGQNDIVIWLGRGWYSPGLPGVTYEGPLVRAQVEELKTGKWVTVLSSDSTWKGRESGYACIGTWKANHFGGEKVNGSLFLANLSAASLDKTDWHAVFEAAIPEHLVTPQAVEPNRIMDTIAPLSVRPFGVNTWLVDMGKTLTGWAAIQFPVLKAGQEVIVEYCDHLDTASRFVDQHQEDRYVAKGEGLEEFCNKFNYHGFRYIKISNLAVEPKKEDIHAYLIHTAYRQASTFKCSDNDLNQIHDMLFYTLRCLSLGGYLVDCPQFERLGYGGDGNASTMTAQTMFNLAPLYSNWLQAWADCIREDGGMPHTAPNPYPAGGGPYWCGFIISASWKTYQNYGDVHILEKYYPVMQQWLGYVAKYTVDGLLKPWPDNDYRNWYLGDWATPAGVDQKNKASVDHVNNCYISECFGTMQKIARILGKTDDAGKYAIQRDRINERIHLTFFDQSKKSYASSSQIDLAFPLLAQIVPDTLIAQVTEALHNEIVINRTGHIATGLVGIPVFTEWAIKNHAAGLFYSMLKKRDYPGYLYMIENGATTTWEHWAGDRSRIHNCYNGIGSWFYQAVGGIRPDDDYPGYQRVVIDPQIPQGITWAKTTKQTPYGMIGVDWSLQDSGIEFNLQVPVGCKAKVVLPRGAKNYILNGRKFKVTQNGGPQFVEIGSGKYTLSSGYKKDQNVVL
jgi:alpha-L-rhamnosidase